jgi:segregation and condensation protein B
VRGVDSGGVMRTLLERRLVKIVGRKDEPGRPLLYATTPEFLEVFGLESLRAMPTLRDLESLRAEEEARRAGDRQLELDALDALAETLSEAPQGDEADYTSSASTPVDDDGV